MESASTADACYVDCNFGRRLNRVGVEEHIGLGRNSSDFFEWLQHTGLVIGHHDRDQLSVRPQSSAHILRIDQAAAVYGEAGDFTAGFLQMF